ncbi:hypothetical protein ID866_6348 [Astraeus odoratus]|nr:hypothetical protein ID866_6348 [Astraeus odoratus]
MAVKEYHQSGTQSQVCAAVEDAISKYMDNVHLSDAIIKIISDNIMCQSLCLTSSLSCLQESII